MLRYLLFAGMILFHTGVQAYPVLPHLEITERQQNAYRYPTDRFFDYHGKEFVLESLRGHGLSLEHRNFFEHIIAHEELGFFGYHSSTQGFRIFQDIIRVTLEEVCDLKIKKDFHFFRIPGQPLLCRESAEQFLKDYKPVNDHLPEQQGQLLSMNFALFGNFNQFGECSVYYFTANHSAFTVAFQNKLEVLFNILGLPKDKIPYLFSIGQPLMEGENAALYQFFDMSHYNPFCKPYTFVDQMCYPSFPGGVPNPILKKLSEVYLDRNPQPFPAQMRLVINNSDTLNPYSPLYIKRYDRIDLEVVKNYETKLREEIRMLPYDPAKAAEYRALLLKLWRVHHE